MLTLRSVQAQILPKGVHCTIQNIVVFFQKISLWRLSNFCNDIKWKVIHLLSYSHISVIHFFLSYLEMWAAVRCANLYISNCLYFICLYFIFLYFKFLYFIYFNYICNSYFCIAYVLISYFCISNFFLWVFLYLKFLYFISL